MKIRMLIVCALGVTGLLIALPGYSRSIAVDDGSTCNSALTGPGVSLGVGPTGSSANPGVSSSFSVYGDCVLDTSSGYGPAASSSGSTDFTPTVFAWINDTSSSVGVPLSDVEVAAEVDVFQLADGWVASFLTGGSTTEEDVSGAFEVQFNYADYFDGNTSCAESGASLTWGDTYDFTGGGGAALCGSTDDFLFSSTGALLGYVDTVGFVEAGPPPGWADVTSVTTPVPEPPTLALFGLGALLLLFRRRTMASSRVG